MLSNVLKIFQNLRLGVLINWVLIKKKCMSTFKTPFFSRATHKGSVGVWWAVLGIYVGTDCNGMERSAMECNGHMPL